MVWDGVTGTIFNMPQVSLSSKVKDILIQPAENEFTESLKSGVAPWSNPGVFPLDIRRCFKKLPEDYSSILDASQQIPQDEIIELDNEFNTRKYRLMSSDDPWYATEEQRRLRDIPTRIQPLPGQSEMIDSIIALDTGPWDEENVKDYHYLADYFVVNKHGGNLVINGIEIKLGEIAGPLPTFAVIECPGGQIAFWWGVNGRDYGTIKSMNNDDSKDKHHPFNRLAGRCGWRRLLIDIAGREQEKLSGTM